MLRASSNLRHASRAAPAKKKGEPLQLSLRSLQAMLELVDEAEAKLNNATGQADIAEIGEATTLDAGVIQSNVREITGALGGDEIGRAHV